MFNSPLENYIASARSPRIIASLMIETLDNLLSKFHFKICCSKLKYTYFKTAMSVVAKCSVFC